MPVILPPSLVADRLRAIREFHKRTGIPKAELDLSGGIDSAVMACLLVEALGPENVILVHSRFATAADQSLRALRLAEALGVPFNDYWGGGTFEVLLDGMKTAIEKANGSKVLAEVEARCEADPTVLGSIRSCLRAPIGRGFNRLLGGGIRHGTGNECEDRWLRFYQKGGDGEVDTNPLAMLSKTEVYQLAFAIAELPSRTEAREVLKDTIAATPSPDLWGNGDGHTDESELKSWLGVPFTYGRIDLETGKPKYYGTIERVSRFLDWCLTRLIPQAEVPKTDACLWDAPDAFWSSIYALAPDHRFFEGQPRELVVPFLKAARKAERQTRHKANPNIPCLGDRDILVAKGILSNDLTLEGNTL